MFATIRISQSPQPRILVPLSAVLHVGNSTGVYIPTSPGKYDLRNVQTGTTHGNQIEIVSGLRDGDRIVTEGAAFLREPVAD
jgi:cobalt-zinc-cadmium efflux system membrane fusion protein